MDTPFTRIIAKHLRRPSGWFGRLVMLPALNRANAALNHAALAQLDLRPDDRVLEVGFGGGDLIARMAPMLTRGTIDGLDYSADVVAFGERRFRDLVAAGRARFVCADVAAMPYPDGSFTKAATCNTIYFWPEPAAALSELRRVLAEGGVLALGFRLGTSLGRHSFAQYQRHYEVEDVRRMMDEAGFRDVRHVPGRNAIGEFSVAVGRK